MKLMILKIISKMGKIPMKCWSVRCRLLPIYMSLLIISKCPNLIKDSRQISNLPCRIKNRSKIRFKINGMGLIRDCTDIQSKSQVLLLKRKSNLIQRNR